MLESPGVKVTLSEKAPFLSEPYVGIRKNLILLILVPVFDKEEYVGFLSKQLNYMKKIF
ncbi:hypothetical protein [Metabacillus sediminilitoris]|uniref:hypothetical protein n=1 Tax=Metabacillus sediminilitoris TaxID=2567941 RepID=UPI0012D75DF1|nr:hypothetical protein [Metabacillus sediminilitoris]QGQ45290.1 hypothetical protein GMB29_08490 [Metabacillus sediminilitoris]